MRDSEYRRTKRELEAELEIARDTLAKVESKVAALDLLWKEHFCKPQPTESTPEHASQVPANTNEKIAVFNGQAQSLIDEATNEFSENFGVREVEKRIQANHPDKTVNRTTIAGRLRKLVDDGRLQLIEAGQGRRPGKFRRIQA